MMGDVVSLCRLTEDKGENDFTGDSPKLGNGFSGDAVFCGDKICSASQLDASVPNLEFTFLIRILGVLLMSCAFFSLEHVSSAWSGLFSFSGVTKLVVFFGLGGVFDVWMVRTLLGDIPISLQALLFSLAGMIKLLRGGSEDLPPKVRGVLLCWGLDLLFSFSLICPVGVSILSVTEKTDVYLPGEDILMFSGTEDLLGVVWRGLGSRDITLGTTLSMSWIS